jgi:tetratricopeptide (TPR) repeat protein
LNTNQKAIEMFEQNEYEKAMELFQQAVHESKDVQSLNNLAWMYLYEEDDEESALELIKDAVDMNPIHYFPYNILGEIYMRKGQWKQAKKALLKSVSIQPSNEAHHNLAVAYYHLGELEKAMEFFLLAAEDSDRTMYNHVKCLIDLGRTTEAKEKLDGFNEEADDFVGEMDVADFYVELYCYNEAIDWFEKGYKDYAKDPYWVGRFVYALFKSENFSRMNQVIQEAIKEKEIEIEDVKKEEVEENWTEKDKQELIEELLNEYNQYKNMIDLITAGYVPILEFDTYRTGACYLFGCNRHNHPEYQQ